jgi:hypothetical protein
MGVSPTCAPGLAEGPCSTGKALDAALHGRNVEAEPVAASQAGQPGLPALDVLRFVAVCAIVWYHANGPGSSLLTFRLPTVALITAFVQSRSRRWNARGVMVPWLFWYGTYALTLLWHVTVHGSSVMSPELSWYNPFIGPSWHLWYGPFALIAGYVAHRCRSENPSVLLGLAAAGFLVAFEMRGAPFPARAWGVALPAIPVGMLLAREATKLRHLALAGAMGALALGTPYVVAIPLVWAASKWKGQRLKNLATFGRSVYWVHLLGIDVVAKIGGGTPRTILLVAFAASALLMLAPFMRRVI